MFQISDKIDNVSRIGIGCMRITGLSDEKAVRSLTEGALECGINFFDHADIYAGGEAETVFGNALTPQLREKMVIQTKCAIRPGICYDFSKEYILNSVDGSLKRLKTDYVDILLLHRPDALMEPEEVTLDNPAICPARAWSMLLTPPIISSDIFIVVTAEVNLRRSIA